MPGDTCTFPRQGRASVADFLRAMREHGVAAVLMADWTPDACTMLPYDGHPPGGVDIQLSPVVLDLLRARYIVSPRPMPRCMVFLPLPPPRTMLFVCQTPSQARMHDCECRHLHALSGKHDGAGKKRRKADRLGQACATCSIVRHSVYVPI